MKIYMLCDMEGVSGLMSLSHTETTNGGGKWRYPEGRKLMMLDINSAAAAALEAGVDELVVCDTHSAGDNVVWEEMLADPRIRYETPNAGYMLPSINETFDGLFLLGHHAKAGTPDAFLDHTMSSASIFDVTINGTSVGEMGLETCYAGHWNVPLIMAQGDEACCNEAQEQFPGVVTARVKRAIGRNRASGSAPALARQLTAQKVREAIAVARGKRLKPFKPDLPMRVRVTYCRTDMADAAAARPGIRRVDGRTVEAIVERQCDVWRWRM